MARLSMTTVEQTLTLIDCPSCAIQFAVPEKWDDNRRDNGQSFYCPNGHPMSYNGEITQLRKKIAQQETALTAARDQQRAAEEIAETARRSAAAARGQVTRMRNRATAGTCPAGCHRTFQNLARHMSTEHPGFRDSEPCS
jgi:hypothetical protein